uniref:Centriolin n=1 Tax=Callorhinchus milii TaxID=7868 RepID=A0A4W3IRU4_CALMI
MRKGSPQVLPWKRHLGSLAEGQSCPVSNLTTQSPSPVNRSSTSGAGSPNRQTLESLAGGISRSPGVRYITDNLIRKLSREENFGFVQSLNLCLSKEGGKKFRYIENLEKCEKMQFLNLSNNLIEKIEKLDKQGKLCELNLSYNLIRKIEGLEHMVNLRNLNLAGNNIEQIPAWVGKKLRSLQVLNLKQNNIALLQDATKLKQLKELTSLNLAENPLANLPHYRLYIIYHLRTLERLDGRPVTSQERQEAHKRFHLEELENLERELERKVKEIERLEEEQSKSLEMIRKQEQLNKSLKQEHLQQKNSCKELEKEMETKNELLKQKTAQLALTCQKQYQMEQEMAFYKIDAKFEPTHYFPTESVEMEDVPRESTYIGKAWYKRNLYIQEGHIGDQVQPGKVGKVQFGGNLLAKEEVRAQLHQALDVQLEEKEKKIQKAQEQLTELQRDKDNIQQQVLRTMEELQKLEELAAQKRISEAEKERIRQQLGHKIQLLNQLRQEAGELEDQMESQCREMDKKQREIDDLQRMLDSTDPEDPRHAHLKAQIASKAQQLDVMSKHYKQLEKRLDEVLSRIAKETEDIKDLEEQLTEGQIAANEALKRDLEGIIAGLQEYLESVKGQAKQAREDCGELQREKEELSHRLAQVEQEKNQLEIVAMDAENLRKEMNDLERSLQEQQELNDSLRQAQGNLSEYEAELESQLQARDIEANRLREELERLRKLSQMEQSALQAELEKERQALENASVQAQVAAENEHANRQIVAQLNCLQTDNTLLKEQLHDVQAQMDQMNKTMIRPEDVSARVSELKRKLQGGLREIRSDTLGRNLNELQEQLHAILDRSELEKAEVFRHQRKLEGEMEALRSKLKKAQEDYKAACERAAEAQVTSDQHRHDGEALELQQQLRNMQKLQILMDQKLQEADEDREKLLAELEDKENKSKMEEARTHQQLLSLDRELNDLKTTVSAADHTAARHLSATKDQLAALQGTVRKLNRNRAQEMLAVERFRAEAARAARDLVKAEAEIDLLQNLVKERERQISDEMQKFDAGENASNAQQLEIDKLNRALTRQRADFTRKDHVLLFLSGNSGEIADLIGEISALRNTLAKQNDHLTSMTDPFNRRGYWYFVPPSSLLSQSSHTRDSGLGSQYQVPPSPSRGLGSGRGAPAGGYWVYSPIRHPSLLSLAGDGDRGSESDDSDLSRRPFVPPAGSVIYTVLPDGAAVPQGSMVYGPPPTAPANGRPASPGTVIYGPPPTGAQVVYGPPPANFSMPFIPVGVLHCNVPEHRDLESEISRLEDIAANQRCQRREDEERAGEGLDQRRQEAEQLHHDIRRLHRERDQLELHVQEIREEARHRNRLEDDIDMLMNEFEMEKSLQQHDEIVDEIECVEQTLLKRRAELRDTDRRLTEAEEHLKSTGDKTKDLIQQYEDTREHLIETERDAEELEKRAQETAVKLVEAEQQLRLMKSDLTELEKHKAEQESVLREINKAVFVAAQQEELAVLDRCLGRKQEELHLLQDDINKRKANLSEVLRDGETEVADKQWQIQEVKGLLEDLSAQKGTLNAQISEKKAHLSLSKQEITQTEAKLEIILAQIIKHKTELKHVLEMMELETSELQGLKLQHEHKLDELERTQGELLKEKGKLENMQFASQRHRAEAERQKQVMERDHHESEQLASKLQSLRDSIESLQKEKTRVGESCHLLDDRLSQSALSNTRIIIIIYPALCTDTGQELQEQEQQLEQKSEELACLYREMEMSTDRLRHLEGQLHSERKSAEKRVSVLKEELKAQRAQLERALNEQKYENSRLRRDMSTIDQAAHENHERSKRVIKELNQTRGEYLELQKQLASREEMEHRQKEIKEAIRGLRSDVKAEISSGLRELDHSCGDLGSDVEAVCEEQAAQQRDVESLKENFPFAANEGRHPTYEERRSLSKFSIKDEQWRGETLRERLQQQEDHLKAQIRKSMSKQAEALCKGRQQTEGSLSSLKKRVDALDELVGSTSTDSIPQSQASSPCSGSLVNCKEHHLVCLNVHIPANLHH